ncbi:uncharacterized protein LOC122507179 [Leptopilina heterotoma]|uniref:uncharacterized protein LOC122507179 n=1 Tax=Leptopilina heterotoma TaxID=63436 RepID=UPI001CAA2AF4|nr:uncharacterized protein LOC122507179 [Leptopilina heterotoma]
MAEFDSSSVSENEKKARVFERGIGKNGKKMTCEDCMDLLELVWMMKDAMDEGAKRVRENLMDICEDGESRDKEIVEIEERLEKLQEMWNEWDSKWKKDKESMWRRMNGLEKFIKEVNEGTEKVEGSEYERLKWKMGDLSRRVDVVENEKRKKNVVIRGMNVGVLEGKRAVEKVLAWVGVNVSVKMVQALGKGEYGVPKLWLVELGSEEEKMDVMRVKGRLKGSVIRIDEDRCWRERRMLWLLRERAWTERVKGKQVRMGKDCIWVDGVKYVVGEDMGGVMEVCKV